VSERENTLESHRWALDNGECALAARLLLAFAPVLMIRGPWQGRVERLAETLRRLDLGADHRSLRVRLLVQLSEACWAVGDWRQARDHAQQAVDESIALDDGLCRADALTALGSIECQLELNRSPLARLRRSLKICRDLGDLRREAINLRNLGFYYKTKCHYAWAISVLDRSIKLLREAGDMSQLVRAVNMLGLVLWHSGQPMPALVRFEEAEQINRALGDLGWVGGHLTNRGLVLTDLDRIDEAMACFDEAERLHLGQGNRAWWAVNQGGRGYATLIRGDVRGLGLLHEALEMSRRVDARNDIAQFLGYIGQGELQYGRPREAANALEEAIGIQRAIRMRGNRRYWANLVRYVQALSQLSDEFSRVLSFVAEANQLGTRLGIGPAEPIRALRECWAVLEQQNKRLGLPRTEP
jgi:tetratricopeptide (TPR) repeat protein